MLFGAALGVGCEGGPISDFPFSEGPDEAPGAGAEDAGSAPIDGSLGDCGTSDAGLSDAEAPDAGDGGDDDLDASGPDDAGVDGDAGLLGVDAAAPPHCPS